MKMDVLGLGESVLSYVNTGNQTVGVNDINKYYPVDYLVVVDLPRRFTGNRLATIKKSIPKKFFTYLEEWRGIVFNYEKINLAPGRGFLNHLHDKDLVCHSNNSTFVACVMAYKLGAKEIYLYGADFNTHPNFTDDPLKRTLKDFKALYDKLLKVGVKMYVTKESRLSEFIPVMNEEPFEIEMDSVTIEHKIHVKIISMGLKKENLTKQQLLEIHKSVIFDISKRYPSQVFFDSKRRVHVLRYNTN